MEEMFSGASSFAQTLGGAWDASKADKNCMFVGSPGKLATGPKYDRVCANPTSTILTVSPTINLIVTVIARVGVRVKVRIRVM